MGIASDKEAGFVIEYAVCGVLLIVGEYGRAGAPIRDNGAGGEATVHQPAWATDSLVPWAP